MNGNLEIRKYWVPGRINFIGEHTDYNYGFVLPGAIDLGLIFTAKASYDEKFHFRSLVLDDNDSCNQDGSESTKPWMRYFSKVFDCFNRRAMCSIPLEIEISGNLPLGAGMSSSSALACGLIYVLNDWNNFSLSKMEMVKLASEAENGTGLDGGMMDQFTILNGRKNHLLHLDCLNMTHEEIPVKLDSFNLVLFDTKVEHSLVQTEYNTRTKECKEGLNLLKQIYPEIKTVRDISLSALAKHKTQMQHDVFKRLNFVLKENDRVQQSVESFRTGNLSKLGDLLYSSHQGLRSEYEVSCPELDFIVDWSLSQDQVLGSRMMGGGFGGCTIQIITKEFVGVLFDELKILFRAKFGHEPKMYEVQLENGIRRLDK